MAKLVSGTYGEALFQLAQEEGKIELFTEEIGGIRLVLDENPDFLRLMTHPRISKEEKLAVMEHVFAGRVSAEMTGFFHTLIEKGRFGEISGIFSFFLEKMREYKKIGVASVKSAAPLSEEQQKKIERKLLETTGFESMEMQYEVDPALIGGLVIRIGDRVVDSSIRTKLEKIKSRLMKVQLPA